MRPHPHRLLPDGPADEFAVTEEGNAFERRMAEWAGLDFGGWRTTFHAGEVNDGNAHYGLGGVSAHAGLFSTAEDVGTLGEMWLRRGVHDGRQVLSAAAVDLAITDQMPPGERSPRPRLGPVPARWSDARGDPPRRRRVLPAGRLAVHAAIVR